LQKLLVRVDERICQHAGLGAAWHEPAIVINFLDLVHLERHSASFLFWRRGMVPL
jgi:hypothetical protein